MALSQWQGSDFINMRERKKLMLLSCWPFESELAARDELWKG